jgi:Arylsulfotransferase (ASST)
MHNGLWSRRTLLQSCLTVTAGLGIGLGTGSDAYAEAGPYLTRPDLVPPPVAVTSRGPLPAGEPPYFLLTAEGTQGQQGPLIIDRRGEVVWFRHAADGGYATNLNVQSYRGKPVLTWWESGKLATSNMSIGAGAAYIADSSYNIISVVRAHGLRTDFHEFNLTDRGTALITCYQRQPADLSQFHGSRHSYVWSGVAQEIDIATGKLVFSWDSLDHVPVSETLHHFYDGTPGRPFDYFHINSIAVADDGNLLISARNTCTVYKVNRRTGAVMWRLGGRSSDFAMGPGAGFWWQHHVREPRAGLLTVFDDGAGPAREPQSRGLLLNLDTAAKRCTLRRAYTSPERPQAQNQGSMQLLPNGSVLIGWGSQPSFSQFTADGSQALYGQFPRGDWSYRALTADWTGTPAGIPDVTAVPASPGGCTVYVSWNGATRVTRWEVSAGTTASVLSPAGGMAKDGFETAIRVKSTGPYFCVAALDAAGNVLGQSAVVRSAGPIRPARAKRPSRAKRPGR